MANEDKQKLKLLKDIKDIENRQAYFTIQGYDGFVPNLLKYVEGGPGITVDRLFPRNLGLTNKEKRTLNRENP